MTDTAKLFVKSELIPVIIQDAETDAVLMLAYMNRESLEKTLEIGETVFWSRSRGELWHKGETSGHTQRVTEIFADCDEDTLLIKVEQTGVACHTGEYSCFHKSINYTRN
jgi:phosphoribosyl-AMP cyclohydrolase/phosphoribosyl-ATP pyrophosphohydrolase/phosphoribosyl-AMP cyclohydrolase